jgi:hypothetical protein
VSRNNRRALSAVAFAIFGAAMAILTHLAGRENGTGGGYVEHPVLRLASLIALGAVVGGALGWLTGASPARATIPLGLGFIAGSAGFVGGAAVGVNVLGAPLIDGNASLLLTSAVAGAGIGWLLGAFVGFAVARQAGRPTKRESRVLRGVGIAALLLGILAAWFQTTLVGPGGLRTRYLASLQVATIVLSALIAITLTIVARTGRAPSEPAAEPRVLIRGLGKTGLVLGCLLSIMVLVLAVQMRATVETGIQGQANARTADILAGAAADYMDEHGVYPADLETLLASGGKVMDGSFVNFAGPVPSGFCVRVGTNIGRDYAGPPFYSNVVHPRPPKARSWTALEGWRGDTCRSP